MILVSEQIVKARLEAKDVAGDTYSNEYDLPVSKDETAPEALRKYNNEVKTEIKENHWFHRFDKAIQTQNIVWYTLTRVRDDETKSVESKQTPDDEVVQDSS